LQKYLITDPVYYKDFKSTLTKAIETYHPDFICFRDKTSTKNAKLSIEIAKYYKIPIIVNQYIDLLKLGFDGIHLTSNQINLVDYFKEYITICSTHNFQEVKKAINSNFITFSPIFNSKNRQGLGIEILDEVYKYHKNIFALGGIISDKEVKLLTQTKAIGFASIRYFV
jgi:thiamine-phosphate pyrophosphorylase